jgi:hypothetical protein
MQRWMVVVVALASLCLCTQAHAQADFQKEGKFGLGLGGALFGSGLTGKLYLSDKVAGQAFVNFGYGYWSGFGGNVDAVFEMADLYKNEQFGLNWNVGVGAAVWTGATYFGAGPEAFIGLRAYLKQVPLEVTVEYKPVLLFGSTYFGGFWNGGGGAIRYYF